ncbi:MAG: alpha/beta hydrolase family esterase [Myxococcaceae bacterium]
MKRFLVRAGMVLTIVAAGLYLYFGYAPSPDEPALTGDLEPGSLNIGGRRRTYHLYAPPSLPKGAPLWIVLHGSTQDGLGIRTFTGIELDALADRRGFAVVYPDGVKGNWNDCRQTDTVAARKENVDDVGVLKALIHELEQKRGIDPKRVYALGYSNGAQMALRLIYQTPGLLAGAALAGAGLPPPANFLCKDDGPTPPLLLVHGTRDPLVPYGGGEATLFGFARRGSVFSANASAQRLARKNGLTGEPSLSTSPHVDPSDPTRVQRRAWSKEGREHVIQYSVENGGHVVPQPRFRAPRALGATTLDLDFPATAVELFLPAKPDGREVP